MKDALVGIMVQMMPFMKPIMWGGAVALVAAAVLGLGGLFSTALRPVSVWAARLAMVAGVFFIACQLAGIMLDVPPSINFGDARKFEFLLVPFWQIGLGLLVPSIVVAWLARPRSAR